jgi:hypothetical protein
MRRLVLFPLIILTALAFSFFSFATSDAEGGKGDDKSSTPTPSQELSDPSATPSSNPSQSLSRESRTVTPVAAPPAPVPTATPSVTAVPVLTATPGWASVLKAEGASLVQIVSSLSQNSAIVQAVVAILTLFLLYLQWQTLRKQKDVQMADERAWIMISQGQSTFAWSTTTRLEFKSNIINKGKSPANITKIRGEYLLLSKQDFECLWTKKSQPEYPPPNPNDRLALFPDDSFTRFFFIDRPFDRKDSDAISTGDLILFFRARVDYEDVFGKHRFTTAAYRYVPTTMPPPHGFWQAGPPAYNRAV